MNGLGYVAIVARAEVPRDRDACAHGKPRKEADEQEDERPGRTDGRQRLIAEKPTDDQRVRRIVKLLKDLTEEHGHGKLRDQLPRTAFRHIQRTSAQGASFPSVQRQLTRYLSVKNTASTAVIFSIPEMRTKSKPVSSRHAQKSGGPQRGPPLWGFSAADQYMPPPMPPWAAAAAIAASALGSGLSATRDSVVRTQEAMDAAFSSAVRVTLVGSTMPDGIMSQ